MDFNFSDEQNMLRESIARFVAAEYDFDKRKAMLASEAGWRPENWAKFAEMGLLAAPLPEAYGGLGGGPLDVLLVMEEFGKGLVIEPYLQTVVLAAGLVEALGTEAHKQELLAGVADGSLIVAPALLEPKGRFALHDVSTTAKRDGAGYVLNGQKAVVIGAPWAQHLLVSARTGGGQREEGHVSIFVVPKSADGVTTRDYPTVDGFRASEIYLENVRVGGEALIGPEGGALDAIIRTVDFGTAALCAEAVGVMRTMHQLTVEYARTRKQFGVPISSFQVLQHRMVDMFMEVEQAASMAIMATLKLGAPEAERKRAVSAAKAKIARGGRFVGQSAVQIHGGMGVTDEMRIAHYFKRMSMIEGQFGDAEYHLRRYQMLSRSDAPEAMAA